MSTLAHQSEGGFNYCEIKFLTCLDCTFLQKTHIHIVTCNITKHAVLNMLICGCRAQACTATITVPTTSLLSVYKPSSILSRGIHLIGTLVSALLECFLRR